LLLLGLLLVTGGLAVWYFLSRPRTNDLEFIGRIEGYETDIGTKVAGRVEQVTVREGAEVRRGQLLVRLDDDELRAQLQGANARIKAAQQDAENARLQIQVLESQIAEAQLRLQQALGDTQGRITQAEAQVAAAEAQLQQAQAQVVEAEAQLQLTRQDRDRYLALAQQGAVGQQRAEQAVTAYETAQATLESRRAAVATAQRQVAAARGGLTQTETTALNPEINSSATQSPQNPTATDASPTGSGPSTGSRGTGNAAAGASPTQ
jgi:HlyD family secretion protein